MLKRTRSEGDLQLLQKKTKTVDKNALLETIRHVRKPELEQAWKEEEEFSIVVIDTYSLKREQKSVAECICNTKWIGNLYVLRIHGSILTHPFWIKMETPDLLSIKDFFFLTGYEKRGSPTYMTMYWLHHALQRSEALQKVQRIVVVSNNWDDPFDFSRNRKVQEYDFVTKNGLPLQYQVGSVSGKAVQAALIDALRPLLNERWILMTRNPYVRKKFMLLQKKTLMLTLCAPNYKILEFQLSKVMRAKEFQPSLKAKQVVNLDRSDEEVKRYVHMHSTFDRMEETVAFLKKHQRAVVVDLIEVLIKKMDLLYGSYVKLASGCIFETTVEQHCVRYMVVDKVKLALKGRIVTLKNHEKLKTDYLLRPQKTAYRVERVDEALVQVKELKTKQILPVPKSYIQEN